MPAAFVSLDCQLHPACGRWKRLARPQFVDRLNPVYSLNPKRYLMTAGPERDLKERIKESNDIVDVVGQYLQLRRQGANWVAHCPWHDDRRPSLQVNQARQNWVCWVCDLRGDVFDFIMRRENVEFREAMKILAERAGIPMTQLERKVAPGSPQDKNALYAACQWAEQQYHQFLFSPEGRIARDYLAERGIGEASIRTFRIGFAPPDFTWLLDAASGAGYAPAVLEACDLVRQGNHGYYEPFRGRLIFPIRDPRDRPIAFGGRVIPGVFPESRQPPAKYLNSRETRLFSKSDTLFGLNLLDNEARREKKLVIVEGYTDVIAAWQAGMRNVIAALGTALNERHVKVLRRYADEVTLVLDGDEAGQKRANEVLEIFVSGDLDLRVLSLPEGLDPFDFLLANGSGPFAEMIAEAPDAIEYRIRVATEGIDLVQDTHAAHQALESILETLSRLPNSLFGGSASRMLRQDQLLTRLARKFSLDRERIRTRLLELRNGRQRDQQGWTSQPELAAEPVALDPKETELIGLVLQDPRLVDLAIESIAPGQFQEGPLREIYEFIVELFHDGEAVTRDRLVLELELPRLKNVLYAVLEEADRKQELLAGHATPESDASERLTAVIQSFERMHEHARQRDVISRLEQGLQEQDELETLEQLLKEARSRIRE